MRFRAVIMAAILALVTFPAEAAGRNVYLERLSAMMPVHAQDTTSAAKDTAALRALPADSTVRRVADSIAPLDSTAIPDSLALPDSLSGQGAVVPAVLDSATLDSLRLVALYDSLDQVFWTRVDTSSLPYMDSAAWALYDSLSRNLPDTHDIKRALRRNAKELRDSIRQAKPRVLETFAFADSLYYRRILVWNADSKFNEVKLTGLDTTYNANFYEAPARKKDLNIIDLGMNGSALQSSNYFKREEVVDAPMFTPYAAETYTPDNLPQYNTKNSYTELAYWGTLFNAKTLEEANLRLLHTQNFTPSFNISLFFQRLGSKGMLANENTANKNTVIAANYLGKRYLAHAAMIRQTISRQENGGIQDSFWIRDTTIDTKAIEVNLTKAENTYKRRTYYLDHSLAIPMNFFRKDKDSLELGGGTMAHIGHYIDFTSYSKIYTDQIALNDAYGREFYFQNFYHNPTTSYDDLSVTSFTNRLFIKLQPFAPDAVLAKINGGIGYQLLSYYNFEPSDYITGRKYDHSHNLYAYAGVSGQFRKYLEWGADGDYYFSGYRMFDFDLNGRIKVSFYPLAEGIHLTGRFSTSLREPHPFEQYINMNHHQWLNAFSKVSTTRAEGQLDIPKWKLRAFFGYSLVGNMIYYDTESVIRQCSEPVSIMSAYLQKDFKIWAFHLDNQILFQLSSKPEVLTLPKLTLNLRYYAQFTVVKDAMDMQIGLNGIFNTMYYAPSYAPDIGQFYNQTEELIRGVPYIDAFVNVQWKRASVFVKVTNLFKGWPEADYFSAYHYIRPTRGVKLGIHWPFYYK